jgi:hypothetical protein
LYWEIHKYKMNFKSFFEEKINLEIEPKKDAIWNRIGSKKEQNWQTSFTYDLDSHRIHFNPSEEIKNKDIYYVNVLLIPDPLAPTSNLQDLAESYPNLIKNEPYWWMDFESVAHGTETVSSGETKPRRATSIFNTVISLLSSKIPKGSNLSFTSDKNQASKISLYTLLANLVSRKFGKTLDTVTHEDEVYFLIH